MKHSKNQAPCASVNGSANQDDWHSLSVPTKPRRQSGMMDWITLSTASATVVVILSSCNGVSRPDGLYADIYTNKGHICARLEEDLTPLAVANFVGLAEGTIENAAYDLETPFYDGTIFSRVVPGHVIQAGSPQSERADESGYSYPNEIHADLSHDHAGALGIANGGPHTNSNQFYITLDDRSYLDGDYIIFGDVIEGLDVVFSIEQGDVIDSVRISRVGDDANAYRPSTETFRELVSAAEESVAVHTTRKQLAEREWISTHWPNLSGPIDGVQTELIVQGDCSMAADEPREVRYNGTRVRYQSHMRGHEGSDFEEVTFGSGEDGAPGHHAPSQTFPFVPGETSINPGLDRAIAEMCAGEKRVVVVPAELGYGVAGTYPPAVAGQARFVVSPNTLLVYEVEVLRN